MSLTGGAFDLVAPSPIVSGLLEWILSGMSGWPALGEALVIELGALVQ